MGGNRWWEDEEGPGCVRNDPVWGKLYGDRGYISAPLRQQFGCESVSQLWDTCFSNYDGDIRCPVL